MLKTATRWQHRYVNEAFHRLVCKQKLSLAEPQILLEPQSHFTGVAMFPHTLHQIPSLGGNSSSVQHPHWASATLRGSHSLYLLPPLHSWHLYLLRNSSLTYQLKPSGPRERDPDKLGKHRPHF